MLAHIQIDLNVSVRNEHIPENERLNMTMKEHIWLVYTDLIQLHGRIPIFIVQKPVYAITFWLNSFPTKYGISATLSLQAIITGHSVEFSKHCLLDFGEYVHTHEDGDNSMESQMIEVLAIFPTGNI